MPTKIPGRATYRAARYGSLVRLTAVGETPNQNDKPDFERLPFLINPPLYGFFFIQADWSLPALQPFVHSEWIAYPASARDVRVVDATGLHRVPIEEVVVPGGEPPVPDPEASGYCVFSRLGTEERLIAPCDSTLIAVYTRDFGPATYGECLEYVASRGGPGL